MSHWRRARSAGSSNEFSETLLFDFVAVLRRLNYVSSKKPVYDFIVYLYTFVCLVVQIFFKKSNVFDCFKNYRRYYFISS